MKPNYAKELSDPETSNNRLSYEELLLNLNN